MCSELLRGLQLKRDSLFLSHYNDTLDLISLPPPHRTAESTGLGTSNHGNQTQNVFAPNGGGYVAVEFHLNEFFIVL